MGKRMVGAKGTSEFERLTERQKACLRLVAAHKTSKEIARELGISRFTVDQRLDSARRALNAPSRREAALRFVRHEEAHPHLYQRLVYEASTIAPEPNSLVSSRSSLNEGHQTTGLSLSRDAAKYLHPVAWRAIAKSGWLGNLVLPPLGGSRHDLSFAAIVLTSLKIAFYSTVLLTATIATVIGAMRMFQT